MTDVEDPDAAPDRPDSAPNVFPDAGPPPVAFPAEPVLEPGVPANAPELFEPPGTATNGPCLLEPQAGSLIPKGWLRPRFRAKAVGNQNLFEWKLSTAGQTNELRVYTASPVWTMPQEMWVTLQAQALDQPINISVRGARFNGSGLDAPAEGGNAGAFTIAPVEANGSIVYWTVNELTGTGASLKGFTVGEDTVQPVMTPTQVGTMCFGCHNSTPDGKYVAFDSRQATTDGRPSYLDIRALDGTFSQPPFLTASARTLMGRLQQHAPTFSDAHWQDGDHKVITEIELTPGKTDMIWTDLEAATTEPGDGWGVIARTSDNGNAGASDFSHDGESIVYVSAAVVTSGINLDDGGGDLRIVPYNSGEGGLSELLIGASATEYSESYPTFSADDKLVAFTRVPPSTFASERGSYNNPKSEVWVVPSTGGVSQRLTANDPPACSGELSPGVMNSWPKWSPKAVTVGGLTYYFMIFSSTRNFGTIPQLYMAPVTVDAAGTITSYPALHLWNQPADQANHTPAWDVFDIIID